jgi:hypothetical protein
MKKLRAELQSVAAPRNRRIRGLLLIFQSFKLVLTSMSDMHEFRGQERVENCAKENEGSDQVERFHPNAIHQFLEESGHLIVMIVFERFGKIDLSMSRIGTRGSTGRLGAATEENDHQQKSEGSQKGNVSAYWCVGVSEFAKHNQFRRDLLGNIAMSKSSLTSSDAVTPICRYADTLPQRLLPQR